MSRAQALLATAQLACGVGSMRLLGSAGVRGRLVSMSAVEHRPADVVSEPLVVQNKLANRLRQLFALPLTLKPASALALTLRGGRTRSLDRVSRSTELVCGDMRYRRGLPGRIRRMPRGTGQIPCRGLRMAGCRAGLRHLDLAARPCPSLLDRLAGPPVRGLHRLEERQNVLCARGCPQGEQPMVQIRERPAAADRDEARVA